MVSLGESFEFQKRMTRIREELGKREVDVRHKLADIEKAKLEALKKAEEMMYSAQHDLEKISSDVTKKNLGTEIKATLNSEITVLKKEIETKYADLRAKIAEKTA